MNQESNQTRGKDKKFLKHFTYAADLVLEYDDCKHNTAIVYSYMLCRYEFFKSKNQGFFESTAEIADSLRMAESTVRLAIDWLKKNELIFVDKKRGIKHFNNIYTVVDKFKLYTNFQTNLKNKESKPVPKPRALNMYHQYDDDEPF